MPVIESRLKELGVTLPSPPVPVASYVPFTISGNLVFISGQIPIAEGAVKYIAKLGVDGGVEVGQAAAQLCAINVLAQLKAACGGDLDRVVQCLKLGVFVNATPDFTEQPQVANGASDLIAAWVRCRAAWRWKWTPSSRSSDGKAGHQRGGGRARALERVRQSERAGRSASLHDI
jgi:enamine deaminase RidA (YjgF/YER057c/UK114 family)